MRGARGARSVACALATALLFGACTLASDLDRLKGEDAGAAGAPTDAAAEEPPCEPGKCVCSNCKNWCQCSALPSAQDQCILDCVAAGLFP